MRRFRLVFLALICLSFISCNKESEVVNTITEAPVNDNIVNVEKDESESIVVEDSIKSYYQNLLGTKVKDLSFKDDLTFGTFDISKYNYGVTEYSKTGEYYGVFGRQFSNFGDLNLEKSFIIPNGLDCVDYDGVSFIISNESNKIISFNEAVIVGYSFGSDNGFDLDFNEGNWLQDGKSYVRVVDDYIIEKVTPYEYYIGPALDIVVSRWKDKLGDSYLYKSDVNTYKEYNSIYNNSLNINFTKIVVNKLENNSEFSRSIFVHSFGEGTYEDITTELIDTNYIYNIEIKGGFSQDSLNYYVCYLWADDQLNTIDDINRYAELRGRSCYKLCDDNNCIFYLVRSSNKDDIQVGFMLDKSSNLIYRNELELSTDDSDEYTKNYIYKLISFTSENIKVK